MDITTFVITVYCFIDDWLKDQRIRQRSPQPTLSDSEVLTMEVVGEFLGIDREATSDEWGVLQPLRLEIAFSSIDGGRTGAVRFYRVMDTIDYSAHEQIQTVRQLLEERSDLAQEITFPTLYPFLLPESLPFATVTFVAQQRYFETAGYTDILFINGRVYDVSSCANRGLYRLIFEGMSRDEIWSISAYFDLAVSELPDSLEFPPFEDLEPQIMGGVFDALAADNFTPSLQTLEQVLESLDYQDPY